MIDLYHTKAQQEYVGPDELKLFADFLPHIGEFALLFVRLERHVTWSIESFVGATRWDGNELEGMVQNFSSRIKFLDICSRPKSRAGPEAAEREDLVSRIRAMNAFRNKLFHNSTTGIRYGEDFLSIMLKQLDKETGKEKPVEINISDLRYQVAQIPALIADLRRWTLGLCPNAENHVP